MQEFAGALQADAKALRSTIETMTQEQKAQEKSAESRLAEERQKVESERKKTLMLEVRFPVASSLTPITSIQ